MQIYLMKHNWQGNYVFQEGKIVEWNEKFLIFMGY